MLQEFKEFALRGNVVDMAVGIIIGAAFSTIVRSLVDDIIMPPIGVVTGGVDFSNMFIALNGEHYPSLAAARQAGAATINFGLFINNVISFMHRRLRAVHGDQGDEPTAPQAGGRPAKRAAAVSRGAAARGNQGRAGEAGLGEAVWPENGFAPFPPARDGNCGKRPLWKIFLPIICCAEQICFFCAAVASWENNFLLQSLYLQRHCLGRANDAGERSLHRHGCCWRRSRRPARSACALTAARREIS